MKNLLIFLIFLISFTSSSQCTYVPTTTQQEVDNLYSRYPNCKKFIYLIIFNDKGRINNLDSLKYIEEVDQLTIVDSMNTIEDISGLDNLNKVRTASFTFHRNYPAIQSLDTIQSILYASLKDSIDLGLFASAKYISGSIVLHNNLIIRGLGKFTSDEVLNIGILYNHLNNTMDNVVPYNGLERLSLAFRDVKNLSTKGVERVKKIDWLVIRSTSHCDFNELYNIPLMDTLTMWGMRKSLDYQQGFVNVKTLKRLELDTIEVGGDLVPLLPALEYVEDYITITNSSDIRNLDFLSRCRVSIPPPSKDPEPYLVVRNNPNLISCVNPFICNLLRTQPNRVILENNGAGCDIATILASCLTSTNDTNDKDITYAYPNPFDQELIIPSSAHSSLMAIYNTAGQHMELDYLDKDRLDTSRWPTGMYIVQYLHDKVMSYRKIVKQ